MLVKEEKFTEKMKKKEKTRRKNIFFSIEKNVFLF